MSRDRRPLLGLLALLVVALVPTLLYAQSVNSYTVMPDELSYMKEAVEIGDRLRPVLPGEPWYSSLSQLASLLFAVPYALANSTVALDVSHAIQAVVMVSAAIPVWLLARDVTRNAWAALTAAALTVAVPWLAMTGTLLTEPAGYAATAWALLACTRAIADPSPRRDVLAVVALAVAVLARLQLAVLAPAFVVALLVFEVAAAGPRAGLRSAYRRHRPLAAIVVVAAVLAALAGGRLSGDYSTVLSQSLVPPGLLHLAHESLAYLAVAVMALPLALTAAFAVTALRDRDAPPAERAFAALALVALPVLLLTVGWFLAGFSATVVKDRYVSMLVPLLAVGMAGALFAKRPAAVAIAVSGAVTALLLWTADLSQAGASLDAPAQTITTVLRGRGGQLGLSAPHLAGLATLLGVLAVAATRRTRRARSVAWLACAGVVLGAALQTNYLMDQVEAGQSGASPEFLRARDWLDRETPGTGGVGLIVGQVDALNPADTTGRWWDVAFHSKQADRSYFLVGSGEYDQRASGASFDARTGVLHGVDQRRHWVVSAEERRFALAGAREVIAVFGFRVLAPAQPVRAAWTLTGAASDTGLLQDGTEATLRVFSGAPAVRVRVDPLPETPQQGVRVRVGARRMTIRPKHSQTVTVPAGRGPVPITVDAPDSDAPVARVGAVTPGAF